MLHIIKFHISFDTPLGSFNGIHGALESSKFLASCFEAFRFTPILKGELWTQIWPMVIKKFAYIKQS
jgi:hypothetical protein